MSKILKVLKENEKRLFLPYQSMFLYGVVIYFIDNFVQFYSNRNTDQPFISPPIYAWWHDKNYITLFLIISTFIIAPLKNYMYSIKYKPINRKIIFWYKSVICNMFVSLASVIGLAFFIFPMFYIRYRFAFINFYIIDYYDKLSCFQIIKLCFNEGNSYGIIEIVLLDISIGVILSKINYLMILIMPIYVSLYQLLYINKEKTTHKFPFEMSKK